MNINTFNLFINNYIVYYERDEQLIAIQFTLYDYSKNCEVYTEPKTFGPVATCRIF